MQPPPQPPPGTGPGHSSQPIANILHQETIRKLSTDRAFERGKTYFNEGRVVDVTRREGSVHARVQGTEPYAVRIWIKDDSLAYACECPQGQDRAFCKHAVAVALSFVGGLGAAAVAVVAAEREERPSLSKTQGIPAGAPAVVPPTPPPAPPPVVVATPAPSPAPPLVVSDGARPRSLADTLRSLTHEELVVLLLETAFDDESFREHLRERLAHRTR